MQGIDKVCAYIVLSCGWLDPGLYGYPDFFLVDYPHDCHLLLCFIPSVIPSYLETLVKLNNDLEWCSWYQLVKLTVCRGNGGHRNSMFQMIEENYWQTLI